MNKGDKQKLIKDRFEQKARSKRQTETKSIRKKLDNKIIEKMYITSRTQNLYNQIKAGTYDKDEYPLLEEVEMLEIENKKFRKEGTLCSKYWYVTINLPDTLEFRDSNLQFLYTKVQKYLRRPFVKTYMYTYEYFTKEGSHPHVHILVYTAGSIPNGKFDKYTRSAFHCLEKEYVPFKSSSTNMLHIKPLSELKIRKKILYIEGDKTGPKRALVERDNVYKHTMTNLELFYTGPFPIPIPTDSEASCLLVE